jgi:hypothetical protein
MKQFGFNNEIFINALSEQANPVPVPFVVPGLECHFPQTVDA